MRLETDDSIWRARLVWLGWKGATLPIHLPYAQWGVFALLFTPITGLLFLIFRTPVVVGTGFGIALFATTWVWQHVDPDRPARKVIRTALTDWRTERHPDGDTPLDPDDTSHITIGGRK